MTTQPNLAKAFCQAQSELKAVQKDAVNPHFKNKYQSLDSIIAMARPILNRHGISVIQNVSGETLVTTLLHSSGESMEFGPLPLKLDKPNMQGLGSAITYARRYAIGALLGISTEEDDDGNGAVSQPIQPTTSEPIGPVTSAKVLSLLEATATDSKKFLDYFKSSSIQALTEKEGQDAIKLLSKRLPK